MPFQPGQSGNPKGRPRRDTFLTQHLIAELNSIDLATEVTRGRNVIRALIGKAEGGDVGAAKEVYDRIEGKVTQPIGGDEENPLVLTLAGLGVSVDAKLARLIVGSTPDVPKPTE